MALIKCTECGKEISDKASVCPNCGCPVEQMSRSEVSNATSVKQTKNKKLNKILDRMLIVVFSLLAIVLILLFVVNSISKKQKNDAFQLYSSELSTVLTDLDGVIDFKISDSYVAITVPSVWYNDTTASKISYCEVMQELVTATRNEQEILVDGFYVPIAFYDSHGNQVGEANSTGKIQVK